MVSVGCWVERRQRAGKRGENFLIKSTAKAERSPESCLYWHAIKRFHFSPFPIIFRNRRTQSKKTTSSHFSGLGLMCTDWPLLTINQVLCMRTFNWIGKLGDGTPCVWSFEDDRRVFLHVASIRDYWQQFLAQMGQTGENSLDASDSHCPTLDPLCKPYPFVFLCYVIGFCRFCLYHTTGRARAHIIACQ